MNSTKIKAFYSELAKEKVIGENLAKKIRDISNEENLSKVIREEIIPLSRERGYDFSEEELLSYEKNAVQKLSSEELLNVSGGISWKSALLSGGLFSLALLGFGSTSSLQADAVIPKAAVESATERLVMEGTDAARNEELPQHQSIPELLKVISVQNTTDEQKNDAIKLIANMAPEDKKDIIKASLEQLKNTLPDDSAVTEDYVNDVFANVNRDASSEEAAADTSIPDFEQTREMVVAATEEQVAAAEEQVARTTVAQDQSTAARMQTDYAYMLNAWNAAEALALSMTEVPQNFRFFNPTNCPTLVKNDGEKYYHWKYNEDGGPGFGEYMRILFPSSTGKLGIGGGAPGVPAFVRDCNPTPTLAAQIAAMIYRYRMGDDEQRTQIKKDIDTVLAKINIIYKKLQNDRTRSELERSFATEFDVSSKDYLPNYTTLMNDYDNLFDVVCNVFHDDESVINYMHNPTAEFKFKAMDTLSKRAPCNDEEKDTICQQLNDWFSLAGTLSRNLNMSFVPKSTKHRVFKTYKHLTIVRNHMEPPLLNEIAEDLKEILNDATLFTSNSFCEALVSANTRLHLLNSAFFAIDNQEHYGTEYNDAAPDKFVPKYFTEQMMMDFCIQHFNSQEELETFYAEASRLIKCPPTQGNMEQIRQSAERISNTLKLLKKLEVTSLSPYKSKPAENGLTYQISTVENGQVTFQSQHFADCADIAVRHVVNLLGFAVGSNWNIFFGGLLDEDGTFTVDEQARLDKHLAALKAAVDGHGSFEFLPLKDRLQLFFYHQSLVGADAVDPTTRTLWEYAICNMNVPENLEEGMYQIRYNKGNYELDTGHINALKLVYNIAKALGLGADKLGNAQAAVDALEDAFANPNSRNADTLRPLLEAAATATFAMINPDIKLTELAVTDTDVSRDVFGTIDTKITRDGKSCSFELLQGPGHGELTHNPIDDKFKFDNGDLKSDTDRLLAFTITKKTDYDDDISDDFYRLFGSCMEDGVKRQRNATDFQALRLLKVLCEEPNNTWRIARAISSNREALKSTKNVCILDEPGTRKTELPLLRFHFENLHGDNRVHYLGKLDDYCGAAKKFYNKYYDPSQVGEHNGFVYLINKDGEVTLCAFVGKAETIEIPSEIHGHPVTKIDDCCFYKNSKIKHVTIPASVQTIGEEALASCYELKAVIFAEGSQLATIGERAFQECWALQALTIPASVRTIGEEAFVSCYELKAVIFAEGSQLATIGDGAFQECRALQALTIPASVRMIGDRVCSYCIKLTTVTFENASTLHEIGVGFRVGCGELETIKLNGPCKLTKALAQELLNQFCASVGREIDKLFGKHDSITIDDGSEVIIDCRSTAQVIIDVTLTGLRSVLQVALAPVNLAMKAVRSARNFINRF